jgi:hypothetical protein
MERPSEKYWIVLQLNLGSIAHFYLPPSTKTSFSYNSLELKISGFLRDFSGQKRMSAVVQERQLEVCTV